MSLSLDQILNAVASLGTLGFALIALYAFLTDKVISRATRDREIADRDRQIAELRQLYEREREDRIEAQKEVPETVEVLKLGIEVINRMTPKGGP